MELETFATQLKALERRTGRTPEQRKKHPEAIPVDIDLITWDREILKPRDITRPTSSKAYASSASRSSPRNNPTFSFTQDFTECSQPSASSSYLEVKATSTGHRAK